MEPGGSAAGRGWPERATSRADPGREAAALRARCRRQALTIDKLGEVVSVLRAGVGALKAENADLRAANERIADARDAGPRFALRAEDSRRVDASLPLDAWAPAAARTLVSDCLSGRVAPQTVERAQLVISELVSNSLRHAAASPDGAVVVRVALEEALCRLEVEDPGCEAEIAPRAPDGRSGGGFGLNIVHTLSERWGIERAAQSGTRVWAHLADVPDERLQDLREAAPRLTADV